MFKKTTLLQSLKLMLLSFAFIVQFYMPVHAADLPFANADLKQIAIEAENPAAPLKMLIFEDKMYFRYGPSRGRMKDVFSIKPILPVNIAGNYFLRIKPEIPFVYVPWPEKKAGLGDIQLDLQLTRYKQEGFVWGVGSIISFPTATDDLLGAGNIGLGPSAMISFIKDPWVIGVSVNNIWSINKNNKRPDVNIMTLSPFVYLNFNDGWSMFFNPDIKADWEAPKNQKWTVPFGGGVGKVLRSGSIAISASAGLYAMLEHPYDASDILGSVSLALIFT